MERLGELPRLYALLAARPAQLLNWAELARTLGLPATTLRRYFALLETLYLVRTLPPGRPTWASARSKAPRSCPRTRAWPSTPWGWTGDA